jgi:FdhD protein
LKSRVTTFDAGAVAERQDTLAIEEPLELRGVVGGESRALTVTMRTPGFDAELAVGWLLSEGIITSSDDLQSIQHLDEESNILEVRFSHEPKLEPRLHATSSACGVCGTASIEVLHKRGLTRFEDQARITSHAVLMMPDQLRQAQGMFDLTGAIHAGGLFSLGGRLIEAREDIGRHNALDKLIGWAMLNDVPLEQRAVLVSGRAGFEIVQKCALARVPIICAVGAPSSLAVQLALDVNMTLIGFLRGRRFNVYSGLERIV